MKRTAATADVLVVGLLAHHLLERGLMRRLTVDGRHVGKRQQVHRDAVGHLAWATTFHLPRRAQVGHIGDAELEG